MRVIAGSARRLLLKTIDTDETRPTTDRIKETLFNILQSDIPGAVFLDLFAGSGGIGIEALSRGAKKAVFVEQNRKAVECIRENLEHTRLADRGVVLKDDAFRAIYSLGKYAPFDVIFMDPPYNRELEKGILELLADSSLLTEDTLVVVEASLETDFSYLPEMGYELVRTKEYKTNKHVFARRVK